MVYLKNYLVILLLLMTLPLLATAHNAVFEGNVHGVVVHARK